MTNPMLRSRIAPTALLLALALTGAWSACAKSLEALAPYPCAKDGSCPDGFTCQAVPPATTSMCLPTVTCDPGAVVCAGKCAHLYEDDEANCGACGNACAPGAVCCQGACAVLDQDAKHCGTCDNACQNAKSCLAGICACKPEDVVCSGDCADLMNDPDHCGTCEHACTNAYCASGLCHACKPYETPCGGKCVTNSDPSNCGACGTSCGAEPCTGGVCGSNTCNGQSFTCATAGDVYYCGSATAGCCKPGFPYFCDNAEAPCWAEPVICSSIVPCNGMYFACTSPGQTFDCGSMTCS